MNARVVVFISALTTVAALALPSAQSAKPAYLTPPQVIADIMDAPPLPGVQLSPDRSTMLLSYRTSMPTIAEVTAPWIGLAGARVNPRNNGARVMGATTGLVLKDVETGTERKLAIPAGGNLSGSFSPDGRKLAVTQTTDSTIRLLVADVATGRVSTVLNDGINGLAGGCTWLENSTGFFCRLIPDGRGSAPPKPQVPTGPNIQESSGRVAPGRTFQDLLSSPYDEQLFDYYNASQMAWVTLTGEKTKIGAAGVYQGASRSSDDKYLVVTRLKRPYSYVLPSFQFPRDVELWDRTGRLVRKLADVPMSDTVPVNGVFDGPRGFTFHPVQADRLFWAEALDKGDPKVKVPQRDRVVMLKAPFTPNRRRCSRPNGATPGSRSQKTGPPLPTSSIAPAACGERGSLTMTSRHHLARYGSCAPRMRMRTRGPRSSGQARGRSCRSVTIST